MNASHGAPAALGFILAIPLFALPALGAPAHDTGYQPAHHRVADFADARVSVLIKGFLASRGRAVRGRCSAMPV
jgi:hypothetical protein